MKKTIFVFGLLLQHADSVVLFSNSSAPGTPLKQMKRQSCEQKHAECLQVQKQGISSLAKKLCEDTGCPWRNDPADPDYCKCYCGSFDEKPDYLHFNSPYLRNPLESGKSLGEQMAEEVRVNAEPLIVRTRVKRKGELKPVELEVRDYREKVLNQINKGRNSPVNYDGILFTGAYASPRHVFAKGMNVATDRYLGVMDREMEFKPSSTWDQAYAIKDITHPDIKDDPVQGFHCTKDSLVAAVFAAKNAGQYLADMSADPLPSPSKPGRYGIDNGFLDSSLEDFWQYEDRNAPETQRPYPAIIDGYVYAVYANGIDINELFPQNPYPHEEEILVPVGFSGQEVLGAWRVARNKDQNTSPPLSARTMHIGDFMPNPNYAYAAEASIDTLMALNPLKKYGSGGMAPQDYDVESMNLGAERTWKEPMAPSFSDTNDQKRRYCYIK